MYGRQYRRYNPVDRRFEERIGGDTGQSPTDDCDTAARDGFLQAMAAFAQASRDEPGCLGFACFEDVSTPNAFTVLEEWDDRACFERHETAEHLAAFKMQVGAMIVSREATRVYAIATVGGLPG